MTLYVSGGTLNHTHSVTHLTSVSFDEITAENHDRSVA